MVKELDKSQEELLKQIGSELRRLRKENTDLNSEKFAKRVIMEKKTYYRIERGNQDYNISSLLKVLLYWKKNLNNSKKLEYINKIVEKILV